MKGWKWVLVLGTLLAVESAGVLPRSREMEERKLIAAVAVDGGGPVTVTALTAVRAVEEEEPEVLTGRGDTLSLALDALQSGSARQGYLGQVEQLLVGEDLDLESLLDFAVRRRDVRMDTLIYVVKGSAGAGLLASKGLLASESGGRDPRGRTVGQLLPRLAQGEYAVIPALKAGPDGALEKAGWAVAGPEGLAGFLEGDAAQGAELLLGQGRGETVALPQASAQLVSVRTWAVGDTVRCALTGRTLQGSGSPADLTAWGERVLSAALAPGWDCWGLDRESAAFAVWDWESRRETGPWRVEVKGRLVDEGW